MIPSRGSSSRWRRPLAGAVLAAVLGCSTEDPAETTALGGGGAVTLWTDSTELFMEYPPLIVGQPETFAVHLTDVTDFQPLRSGRVTSSLTDQLPGSSKVIPSLSKDSGRSRSGARSHAAERDARAATHDQPTRLDLDL